ncbi:hypothetical protein CCUS01_06144 [Colletotrichum cuscutae]|uniref:Uncharacterized protein n=1 Tax=Colletotrichum cuscutae TaxID=1209917 RepID=A0AAI9V5R1_9PEZI|nr:hypothetical protein CCUS01_06144 [Colletotrichum cuscutae]
MGSESRMQTYILNHVLHRPSHRETPPSQFASKPAYNGPAIGTSSLGTSDDICTAMSSRKDIRPAISRRLPQKALEKGATPRSVFGGYRLPRDAMIGISTGAVSLLSNKVQDLLARHWVSPTHASHACLSLALCLNEIRKANGNMLARIGDVQRRTARRLSNSPMRLSVGPLFGKRIRKANREPRRTEVGHCGPNPCVEQLVCRRIQPIKRCYPTISWRCSFDICRVVDYECRRHHNSYLHPRDPAYAQLRRRPVPDNKQRNPPRAQQKHVICCSVCDIVLLRDAGVIRESNEQRPLLLWRQTEIWLRRNGKKWKVGKCCLFCG